MSVIKSFSVGNGDMFYIYHNSDNFTIIDCFLNDGNQNEIVGELKKLSHQKSISRFICTHPDQDHYGGLEILDDCLPIQNFYVVKNNAKKTSVTDSLKRYCTLRDDADKAYYIYKDCVRKWMNQEDDVRGSSGISILWPHTSNPEFIEALSACNAGASFNNTSAVIRYSLEGGASALWLGDLEHDFMESIKDDIELTKTTIVFASHHGRESGKIPNSWLKKLDPQIIIIGEAPSRHLHYYTGYKTITQNSSGDITMDFVDGEVHIYTSNPAYKIEYLDNKYQKKFTGYKGTLTVETEYTLINMGDE